MEIQNLPVGWTVRIFSTAGSEVRAFTNTQQNDLTWTWDFENESGRRVVRSLYLVRVIDVDGVVRRSGRFVVQSHQ
jgi:hypothetical protein